MAGKSIKGLTIEIGGDTTKLGQALDNVKKQSKNLSGELSEVNKLLKFDPENTELLTQKQKILANSIEDTSAELKILKEAEKQVQKQFEKGEASEAQVRALQREIIDTTNRLEHYEDEAKKTAKALKGMDDATEEVEESSGELGSTLADVVKTGLASLAAGVTAVIGAMVGSAEATREYRTAMGKLETAFATAGHEADAANETYKTLQGVLGDTDQAVEASNHLAQLCDNEEELATWTDIATGVYATFGDSLPIEGLTEAANETAKTGALTGGLADALNWAGVSEDDFQASLDACSSEQERQALITETLNGLYTEAAEKYKEVNAEVIRANEANEAWTATMAEMGEVVEPVLTDIKLLGASLLSEFIPGVKDATEAFRGLLNGDAGAAEGLGSALSGIVTQLLGKVSELAPALLQVAMSLISTLVRQLATMLPQIVDTAMSLISQVISTIAAELPTLLPVLVQAIFSAIDHILMGLPEILSAISALVDGIVAALPEVLRLMYDRIPEIIIDLLWGVLPALLDAVISIVTALVDSADEITAALLPLIPLIVEFICEAIAENLPVLLDAIINLVVLLATEVLPKIIWEVTKMTPQILKAVVLGLGQILASVVTWFGGLFSRIGEWFGNIIAKVKEFGAEFLEKFKEFLSQLPERAGYFLGMVIGKVATWAVEMYRKAKEAGKNFVTNLINFVKNLPSNIWTWLQNTIAKVQTMATTLPQKGKEAAKNLVTSVVNGVKSLPEKMKKVATDMVKGLVNGITSMVDWVKDKIKSFSEGILNGIKDFFKVKSPSRVMRDEVGAMLAEGLAVGIEDNADSPLDAMTHLSEDMLAEAEGLNGLTLERQLNHTFGPSTAAAAAENTLLGKLDKILTAIESGQMLVLDGDALVGGTAARYNEKLGQMQLLAARGAI